MTTHLHMHASAETDTEPPIDLGAPLLSGPAVTPAEASGTDTSKIVVCSFYTADDYYRGHADTLRANLGRLGLAHELQEIEKGEDEDWADICRKKIGFLARVCEENPDKKVFWIDVDCSLISFPEYVAASTADLIGFQRGFGSALRIGYANRTRFWEPCFFGINTTPSARKFIADAKALEQDMTIKATDDYFFEESWRANASEMTFQIIPSASVLARGAETSDVVPFFSFGASGNVAEFKDKVVQHTGVDGQGKPRRRSPVRLRALRLAKKIERSLPERSASSLRKIADQAGVTHLLTGGGPDGIPAGAGSAHRTRIVREVLAAGQRGEVARLQDAYERLESNWIPTKAEIAAKRAADSFAHYATTNPEAGPVDLAWWTRPFPGNFGDWLSPLVVSSCSGRPVTYRPPTARSTQPHLVSVGSIGRFIKPQSIVVGTGVSSTEIEIERKARYLSVRGPITAQLVKDCGGPAVDSFGDPGALLSRILPVERGTTNGRIALVRHFKHTNVPVTLTENMDELSVLMSHPSSVRTFVETLNQYDAVVTSAMHVMIACHSYGIPCALIGLEGLESSVHGTGIKYRDYALGAGLSQVYEPVVVGWNMNLLPLDSLLGTEKISEEKLDEIEHALTLGVGEYLDRLS